MRTFLLFLFLQAGLWSSAQERCTSIDYTEAQRAANPLEAQRIIEAENFLHKKISSPSINSRSVAPTVIRIPVVVHIVYKNASDNISDAQVKSQIEALNRDFRRLNSDTTNTPDRFKLLGADVQIEFYLATADPKGRSTSGIVRKQTSITNFLNNDKIKSSGLGGDDAWDGRNYLNIWVGRLIAGAGYASVPGSDATKDGVVISTSAFGAINMSGYYNMGRTATHEVGHWLGLKHIWGDAQCGDDGIFDTPQQSTYTQTCPTGFRSTCNNGEMGDMYMNYMDYTADACMNLFTQGQKIKMRACFDEGGPRESLLVSKGLREPWLEEAALPGNTQKVSVYPNPAKNELNIIVGAESIGKNISILNINGTVLQSVQVKSATQKLNIANLQAGLYFIKGEGFSEKFAKL